MDCPFTGEKLLLVPALNPDVALIHVQRCDRLRQCPDRRAAIHGHRSRDGRQQGDPDARSASSPTTRSGARRTSTKIPFFAVDAVVELPFGCAPHECYGVYEPMIRHMEYYVGLVNKDPVKGMQEYLDRFVYGPKSWTEFLDLIGIDELLDSARAGRVIYDA